MKISRLGFASMSRWIASAHGFVPSPAMSFADTIPTACRETADNTNKAVKMQFFMRECFNHPLTTSVFTASTVRTAGS